MNRWDEESWDRITPLALFWEVIFKEKACKINTLGLDIIERRRWTELNRIQEANRLLAENLVESIIKDYDACGVAAAIIDKNGVTQYEKFWGSKELGTGEKPDGETIFGLASVTKSFTALAIMQME